MKKFEHTKGECIPTSNDKPTEYCFAILWLLNRAVVDTDQGWIAVDRKVLNNKVVEQISLLLLRVIIDYLETFYPESKVSSEVSQWIATRPGKARDLVFEFCLTGEDRMLELKNECAESIRYLSSNLLTDQKELEFEAEKIILDQDKLGFLDNRLEALRQELSGKKIQQPFGIESLGQTQQTQAFRGQFDLCDNTVKEPKTIAGAAVVDGFCDSENYVLLRTPGKDKRSDHFLVTSAKLIEIAITARQRHCQVSYRGKELYALGAKKPTLQLENLEMIDSDQPEQ